MYSRLRFIWIVEWRTSSIIWMASPLWTSGFGTALIASGIARAAEISGKGMMRQEQLLPLHPALLDLAEHVAADGAVHRAEDAVVLLLLHREVGAQDLLERVLLGGLLERVVGRVLVDRLHERRIPGQLLDLVVSLRDAGSAHGETSSPYDEVVDTAVDSDIRVGAGGRSRTTGSSEIAGTAGPPRTSAACCGDVAQRRRERLALQLEAARRHRDARAPRPSGRRPLRTGAAGSRSPRRTPRSRRRSPPARISASCARSSSRRR